MSGISVITATLNSARYLPRLMATLPKDVEQVVVDGGSDDATRAIAQARSGTAFFAVPGSSIYEAWNVALEKATGDWVCFANSDDELDWQFPAAATRQVDASHPADIHWGAYRYLLADALAGPAATDTHVVHALDLESVLFGIPAINAGLFRRSLFERVGTFDTSLELAADRDWLLRCLLAGVGQRHAGGFTYCYRMHPGSRTLDPARSGASRIGLDHMAMATKHLQAPGAANRSVLGRFYADGLLTVLAAGARKRDFAGVCRVLGRAMRERPISVLQLPAATAHRLDRRRRR